ncbi:MAG: hypothetical protein C6W57_16565 [Caldibacillus debilis]|nr:MAG: hypothetical protein C6W57_16565 [Caldibacillus debilis]
MNGRSETGSRFCAVRKGISFRAVFSFARRGCTGESAGGCPRQDMGVTGRGRGPGALPACREDLFAGDPEPSGFSVSPFPGKIP